VTDPFVVVGGDAAGLSAASKCKREDPDRDVVVFEKGSWVSYAHCGTPYYVKGEVESLLDLTTLSPTAIEERGIDLYRNHEVVAVDPDAKAVTVDADGERIEQPYGDLLIATGAHALTDPIQGADLGGVFTMHGLDSAAALRAFLTPSGDADPDSVDGDFVDREFVARYANRSPPESVAIVGGGYVGIEMAEAFSAYDRDVHLFQRSGSLLPPFGEVVGETVAETLRDQDVTLHLDTPVTCLAGTDRVSALETPTERFDVDCVLIGIGIRPNVDLVRDTPIECGDSGAIATDEYGRTTVEDVYAAGDCAEMRHAVTGEPVWIPLGLTANRAGRAIGQTVAGSSSPVAGSSSTVGTVAGTAVVKAFETECGRSGILDHDRAEAAGFDPVSETVTAGSRSGYYPGGSDTTVTLCADDSTGRLLGGSIVGTDRAAIRIDTLATALENDMTVPELERLDLAYAPPFSPVWDPILVAAKVTNGSLSAE
jgi:NADPH-dependent 2,4-dienoyl-CoA reductase/sulfur reductase-like enzyme